MTQQDVRKNKNKVESDLKFTAKLSLCVQLIGLTKISRGRNLTEKMFFKCCCDLSSTL